MQIPKHKPPSRIRYEKSHPTVSFRLNRELKERLEKVLEGKSFADFVKEGLGVREREKKSVKETHDSGYEEGYEEAQEEFLVYAPCAICGTPIVVCSDEDKAKVARLIRSEKWTHPACRHAKRGYPPQGV